MSQQSSHKKPNSQKKAGLPPVNFEFDDFTIPSLVEASLNNIPLSDEEIQQLNYIKQDKILSQEYFGLLAIMGSLNSSQQKTSELVYIIKDGENKTHRVNQDQTLYRDYLLKSTAQVIGAEFESDQPGTIFQRTFPLIELDLTLDFTSPGQVHLKALDPKPNTHSIGDFGNQPESESKIDGQGWYLQLATSEQLLDFYFDENGSISLPPLLPEVVSWRLLKPSS